MSAGVGNKARRYRNAAIAAVVCGLFLFFYIDDWRRDFVTNEAEISDRTADPTLAPLVLDRSTEESVEAIRWAARRIRNWEYVGEVHDGNMTSILFVRTSRLWRFKDDVTIRVKDLGNRRVVTGESRSRVGVGDLGQNPRNLRRFTSELRAVLGGARPAERTERTR